MFEAPLTIDVSTLAYVQSPACGYTFTSAYSWSTLPSYIVEAPSGSGKIIVSSSNLSHKGTAALYFTNVITIASNGPKTNTQFSLNQVSDRISFNVAIQDPCSGSTANAVVFHNANSQVITAGSVTNGNTLAITIKAPTNSFATSEGVIDRCGPMSA